MYFPHQSHFVSVKQIFIDSRGEMMELESILCLAHFLKVIWIDTNTPSLKCSRINYKNGWFMNYEQIILLTM